MSGRTARAPRALPARLDCPDYQALKAVEAVVGKASPIPPWRHPVEVAAVAVK